MRRLVISLVALVVVSFGAWAVYAEPAAPKPEGAAQPQQAQAVYQCPMHPEVMATWPGTCPKCGMTLKKMSAATGMTGMMGMQPGQSGPQMEATMARHQMLMQAQLSKNDPAALLSVKDKLKLTDEQVSKLESLARETGQKAEAAPDGRAAQDAGHDPRRAQVRDGHVQPDDDHDGRRHGGRQHGHGAAHDAGHGQVAL